VEKDKQVVSVDDQLFIHYKGINPQTGGHLVHFEFKNRKMAKLMEQLQEKMASNQDKQIAALLGHGIVTYVEHRGSDVDVQDEQAVLAYIDQEGNNFKEFLLGMFGEHVRQSVKSFARLEKQFQKNSISEYNLLQDLKNYLALQLMETRNLVDHEFMANHSVIQQAQFSFQKV
jgi:hypothetical protein